MYQENNIGEYICTGKREELSHYGDGLFLFVMRTETVYNNLCAVGWLI
jgi:hypothetical protein